MQDIVAIVPSVKLWISNIYAELTTPKNLISDYDIWNITIFYVFSI